MNNVFFMLHGMPLSNWCKKWNLEPFNGKCNICENTVVVNIPFVYKRMVGLASECMCGNKNLPFEFIEKPSNDRISINDLCKGR